MPKSNQKPKRALAPAIEESTIPPQSIKETQTIARVIKGEGNNLYSVTLPAIFTVEATKDVSKEAESYLVELLPVLRSTVFLRRNGYVLIDTDRELFGGRENKIIGIIIGVVLSGKLERDWRSKPYWPSEFMKMKAWDQDSDDEDEGPQMPSSDDES